MFLFANNFWHVIQLYCYNLSLENFCECSFFNIFPLTSSEAEVHCWWLLGDPYRDPKRGFYSCRCLFAGLNVWHSPHWKRADHGAWYPGLWYQVACDSHEIIEICIRNRSKSNRLSICAYDLLFFVQGFAVFDPRIRGINGLNTPDLQRVLQQRDVASEVGQWYSLCHCRFLM